MQLSKKQIKETHIIEAAEKIFGKYGFQNAKMVDIADEAGITKVTLYSYFQSKENLYMAITYRALQLLNDEYYKVINSHKNKSGLDTTIALTKCFLDFCENNYLYSEAMLNYFSMVRSTSLGSDQMKLTDGLKDSVYFHKIQDIHNLAFKLSAHEIKRGMEDGSIKSTIDPMFHTLHGWTVTIGYVKILAASGENASPLFNVSLSELKRYNLDLIRSILGSEQ